MAFVELNRLSKAYAGQVAVNAVDLAIEKGQLVCLLGPSGCGKTTTLRLIAGFVQPTSGEIRVGGRLVSSSTSVVPPEARGMSMIFQSYALWPHMTVAENVGYGLKLRRLSRSDIAARVETILKATRLDALAARYPSELSGGQQQRVALARALVVEPETLLLDEPLSNLDANLREEMRFEIRRLHDEFRYTTVYVTHDQTEAMTAADMIVVMNQGGIEQAGSPEDIYQRPVSKFTAQFIGGANIFLGRRVGPDIVECGGGLVLRCGSGDFAPENHDTTVCVRHHATALSLAPPDNVQTNAIRATVQRQTYLGSHRDYLVSLPGGATARAIAPVELSISPGGAAWLNCPPENCRALAR